jgi:hypothetical protein
MSHSFTSRWNGTELMDDPACDTGKLLRTLDQLRVINRLVGRYRTLLTRTVLADMERDPGRTYHFVDLGAGGCDIPVWLLGEAERRGLDLRVTALDGDPRIVEHARRTVGGRAGLEIRLGDLRDPRAFDACDYLFMNHVLHHLPDAIIPGIVRAMDARAARGWVVSDLLRSRWSYAGFALLGLCFRGSFTAEDGLRSIRRGFTAWELAGYARSAGVSARVIARPPGRLALIGGELANPDVVFPRIPGRSCSGRSGLDG